MVEKTADFYLGSSDSYGEWARPRDCWIVAHTQMEDGRVSVLVNVEPPVIGQPFGLGGKDLRSLVLAARWKGTAFEQGFYPMPVLIYRITKPVAGHEVVPNSHINLEAWGEVYPTREDAEHAKDPSRIIAWSRHARR